MEEASAKAQEMKGTKSVKEVFVSEAGFESWEEAVESVPQYTEDVKSYAGMKVKGKDLPADFKVE